MSRRPSLRAPDITVTFLDLVTLLTAFQLLSLALAGRPAEDIARVRETFSPRGPALVSLARPAEPSQASQERPRALDLQYLFTVLAQSFEVTAADRRPALALASGGLVITLGEEARDPQALGLIAQALAGFRNPVDVVVTAPAEDAGTALERAEAVAAALHMAGLERPLGRAVRLGVAASETAIAIRP